MSRFKLWAVVPFMLLVGGISAAMAQTSPPPTTQSKQQALDPDLAQFRSAYTSGDGIAYVVIDDEKGEKIYRYGDASRVTAKRDTRGYMLFTCGSPHVFIPEKATDKAALLTAKVVKADDPRFAELDTKYVSSCRNPFVKSAVPKAKS
jgi:hypothetical protein